jgi:uncharacterized damage-inducible protein DinB
MVEVKALFEYNWYCRAKFLDAMSKLPWEKIIENREASFNSMRNVFIHSLEAEQGWFKRLALEKFDVWPSHSYDNDFKDIEAMRKYMVEVGTGSRAYLEKLMPGDLDKIFSWTGKDKTINKFRIEDILLHLVEEEIHHRGEILCLMWQINATPPYTSYTTYLKETKKEQ